MTGAARLELPPVGRIAALDYGTVRIGVAVTDPERRFASPHSSYTRRDEKRDADFLRQLADEERVVGFVVGLPVHTSGQESRKSVEARRFAGWVAAQTGRPVVLFDERYTTVAADEMMRGTGLTRNRRRDRRDMLAAQVLLSAFLESGCRVTEEVEPLE